MGRLHKWFRPAVCLALCLLMLPVGAFAAETEPSMQWSCEGNTLWISCQGEMDLSQGIPWEEYKKEITAVRIDEGTVSVAADAFSGCEKLGSVTLPTTLTSIGENGFRDCEKLYWITLPEGLVSIADGAFLGCKVLSSVTVPKNTSAIDPEAFEPETRIQGFTNSAAEDYAKERGCVFSAIGGRPSAKRDEIWGDLHWTLRYGVMELEGTGQVSESMPWETDRCDIAEVNVAEGITAIGAGAFRDCRKLKVVSLPEGVVSIGEKAFYGCSALKEIQIPASVTEIAENAFDDNTVVLMAEKAAAEEASEPESEESVSEGEPKTEEVSSEPESVPEEPGNPMLRLSTASARPGEKAELTVSLENNPGICGMNFRITYDTAAMTLTDYDCAAGEMNFSDWTVGIGAGEKALWISTEAFEGSGPVLNLTFTILNSASEGEREVTLTEAVLVNQSEQTVEPQVETGLITVNAGMIGDVNGDGRVTAADSLRLKRYLAGQETQMELLNADMNGDGTVDMLDALRLDQFLSGKIETLR